MILSKNIHKFYENNHILKGINLNIDEGEIVSLVGASGAGKTTLLQILGTIDSYDINSNAHEKTNIIDGLKIDFDDSWVQLRKSNTEPIIRVYSEAKSQEEAEKLSKKFISEIKKFS